MAARLESELTTMLSRPITTTLVGRSPPIHVVHVIQHLQTGGLENGLVNLVNGLSSESMRHSIVCLSNYSDFRQRITAAVDVVAIEKQPGKDWAHYRRLAAALRGLRPTIVHTRNVGALDSILVARLSGARYCIHGEHGWDVHDLDGTSARYRLYRKALRPFVSRYVAVTRDIKQWLIESIDIAPDRIAQIYNGVDTARFCPQGADAGIRRDLGWSAEAIVLGTVGRLKTVKNQVLLVRGFAQLRERLPQLLVDRLRLLIVGSGPDRAMLEAEALRHGVARACGFVGERSDVERVMREIDLFVLPSLNEGLSNTLLEAMATTKPVVASAVGGNLELIDGYGCGALFESNDSAALADVLERYVTSESLRREHGSAGRARVEREFALELMLSRYLQLYLDVVRAPQPHAQGVN